MTSNDTAASARLFDFGVDKNISEWTLRSPEQDSLKLSNKYATLESHSLEFHSPAWKTGMEEWPAFQGEPLIKDWNGYDRFVIDITNPNPMNIGLFMHISDSKTEFRKGYSHDFMLPANGIRRYVADISVMPDVVNRSNISIVHFYTFCPPEDTRIYINDIVLLKPGEPLPDTPRAMFRVEESFIHIEMKKARDAVENCKSIIRKNRDSRLEIFEKELGSIPSSDYTDFDELLASAERIRTITGRIQRLYSLITLRKSLEKLDIPTDRMLVGIAGSTQKVLPRDVPVTLMAAKSIDISAARNEKESFQIAVTPSGVDPLKNVSVKISDLCSENGNVLPSSNVDCDVVSYVKTDSPCYPVNYVGWWPDPILDFIDSVDIDPETVQTFWVRVRVLKDQAPGLYKGKLTVLAEDADPVILDVALKARSFTLPDCTPIPTAITALVGESSDRIINDICGRDNWQRKLKYDYADFLADYYIDFDHLYEPGPPDYDILKHLHDEGKLVAFNLGSFDNAGKNIDHFKPIYEKCEEMGILDHAYIYGFDECGSDRFDEIADSTTRLKATFPDILLLTTTIDKSYGMDSVMKSIDAWCPLTPDYDLEKAAKARVAGKKVWWYICCGPRNPYANWFVDYDAVEIRLLMGAMTAKYSPDGFLYYSLTLWGDNNPITSGPFTNWNPRSFTQHNGDGSIFCCGPGGKPVPTIRLENYRDGLEDFAYAKILESIIDKYNVRGDSLTLKERKWLVNAREALIVPENLVKDLATYSHDLKLLETWRDKVADMIDSSGMSDINPWGKDFGVKGFDE